MEIFDIFGVITKILINPSAIKGLHSIYNRSRFILNFFQLLVWSDLKYPVEALTRDQLGVSKYSHTKDYFYRNRFPLLSQKVYHLGYYSQLFEAGQVEGVKTFKKEQKAFLYLIRNHEY